MIANKSEMVLKRSADELDWENSEKHSASSLFPPKNLRTNSCRSSTHELRTLRKRNEVGGATGKPSSHGHDASRTSRQTGYW